MLAVTRVPPPSGLSIDQVAVESGHAITESVQAAAVRGVGTADAVVARPRAEDPRASVSAQPGMGRVRVLDDVGQRLGDDEVSGGLDFLREPAVQSQVELNRHRRSLCERVERGCESAVGEHRRVDPARELAQLGLRLAQRRDRPVEQLDRRLLGDPAAQHLQLERERHEPLLGAIVQVALEPAAGLHRRLDDPAPGCPELVQPGVEVGLEPLVVEREHGPGGRRLDDFGRA